MRTWLKASSALGFLILASCVTINIYFPASAAEKVADEIIEDIQKQNGQPAAPANESQPQSSVPWLRHQAESVIGALARSVASDVHAAEADLSADSPTIRKLQAAMKSRFGALSPFYNSGAVGFTTQALIAVRDASSVSLKDRARVKQLVDAENRDRNALYRAIAVANGQPQWEADIRETFARRWVANANSGWWYQTASGSWKQK